MSSHPIENVCPPFKSDTLEDCEKWKSEIVEVGDPVVGTLPELTADLTGLLVALVVAAAQRRGIFVHHLAWRKY